MELSSERAQLDRPWYGMEWKKGFKSLVINTRWRARTLITHSLYLASQVVDLVYISSIESLRSQQKKKIVSCTTKPPSREVSERDRESVMRKVAVAMLLVLLVASGSVTRAAARALAPGAQPAVSGGGGSADNAPPPKPTSHGRGLQRLLNKSTGPHASCPTFDKNKNCSPSAP